MSFAPVPKERVLSTLNEDGTRRWLRPLVSHGRFWNRRLVVAWGLIALFLALPMIEVGGKPAILLDLPRREFTFFGTTLLPTDSALLMLFLLGTFLSIFLLTALFGRVWCGWGCPQTVYLEYVYRPLERLFEGSRKQQEKLDLHPFHWRRVAKLATFAVVSVLVANVFLAYFVPVDQLRQWMVSSPAEHPAGFAVVAITSVLMFVDFAWFREQMCIVACPYARLQSALLDKRSLIVAYDPVRGEPRGKLTKRSASELALARAAELPLPQKGDCVDCRACVNTCPTGIDIRDGLQLECISCTQCIDACDAVMDKIKRPRGLIRYTNQEALEHPDQAYTLRHKLLRPRVILYPIGLLIIGGLFLWALGRRTSAELTVLRGIGAPFTVAESGEVTNQIRVKLHNFSGGTRKYAIRLASGSQGQGGLQLVAPENPLPVTKGELRTTTVFVLAPKGALPGGRRTIEIQVDDGQGFAQTREFQLLGPKDGDR